MGASKGIIHPREKRWAKANFTGGFLGCERSSCSSGVLLEWGSCRHSAPAAPGFFYEGPSCLQWVRYESPKAAPHFGETPLPPLGICHPQGMGGTAACDQLGLG